MIIVICPDCKKYKHLSGEVGDGEFQPRCECPTPPAPPPPPPVHWVETEEEMKRPKFFLKRVEVGNFDTESIPSDATSPVTISIFARIASFGVKRHVDNSLFDIGFSPRLQSRRSPKSWYWRWLRNKHKRARRIAERK
jgi:hypothetical protein